MKTNGMFLFGRIAENFWKDFSLGIHNLDINV